MLSSATQACSTRQSTAVIAHITILSISAPTKRSTICAASVRSLDLLALLDLTYNSSATERKTEAARMELWLSPSTLQACLACSGMTMFFVASLYVWRILDAHASCQGQRYFRQ